MFKKYRNITLLWFFLITCYVKTFALSLQTDLIDSNGQINIQYYLNLYALDTNLTLMLGSTNTQLQQQ